MPSTNSRALDVGRVGHVLVCNGSDHAQAGECSACEGCVGPSARVQLKLCT